MFVTRSRRSSTPWKASVLLISALLVDEDTTEQQLVDFLMRERQFTVVTREGLAGTLTGIKRRCSDEAHVAAKRPKHQGNTAQIVLSLEQDFTRAPSKSVVASTITARCPAVPATKILTRGAFSPFIDLSDGEEAVVRPNHPVDFMTATLLSTATSGVSDAAAYTLSREKKIICTDAAAVFTSRHSAVPQSKVVTKIIKLKGNKIEDLPVIAKMWKREKYFLERLRHDNIVSLKAFDARVFAIVLEYAPASLNNSPKTFTQEDAFKVLLGMSSALAYLTSKRVVHNDIKPANISYSPERGPVLLDFGLGSELDDQPSSGGSHCYIPPEFIIDKQRGLPGDVWALGVTMLYVLRKTKLPERRAGYWVIAKIRTPGEDLKKMRTWLETVGCIRRKLRHVDVVEGLVYDMLDPARKSRIQAEQIKQTLENVVAGNSLSP
ncbi:serine/threonine protein kinase-20 [Colletotrichum plurivorum]|uniref:Serine/threonine protein kinase-20 n=1 Tax=Colletotrichum plurivorum TaxID=2175906 RepID=A0A8H6J551_9PEZI|nr:serine/threonine protein kinase-20 [Colletotrichum plurivorum]